MIAKLFCKIQRLVKTGKIRTNATASEPVFVCFVQPRHAGRTFRDFRYYSMAERGAGSYRHMISYEPFFNTLKKKKITTYCLVNHYGFSKGTLDSLKQGRNINISTLDYLCQLLECEPDDIIQYIPEVYQKPGYKL